MTMASLVPTKPVAVILSLLVVWMVALGLQRDEPFTGLKGALSDIYKVAGSPGRIGPDESPPPPHTTPLPATKRPQHQQQQQQHPDTTTKQPPEPDELSTFKAEWLATELGGHFDGTRLGEACGETKWREDVVLQMLHSRGGIGNVRGTILDFIYFAIRSGSHVVLPGYVKRTDTSLDWMDETNGYHPFDNMFDAEWLTTTMGLHCPQMRMYLTADEVPCNNNNTPDAEYNMPSARSDKQAANNEPRLLAHFDRWLGDQPGYDPDAVNLVKSTAQIWNFDLYPQPRLRAALGRLLKISPRIRDLAAAAVFNMRPHVGPAILNPGDQLHRDAYCGVHLRTEVDAANSGWLKNYGGFETQTDVYLEMCKRQGLQVIYVASGNQGDIVKFTEKGKKHGVTVLSRQDLITAPLDRELLDSLTWDQHGALDWEILSRSSFFSGPTMSSFSWNIAFRRYFYIQGDERLKRENPYAIQEEETQVTYDDGLSRVVFRTPPETMIDFSMDEKAPRGMFP